MISKQDLSLSPKGRDHLWHELRSHLRVRSPVVVSSAKAELLNLKGKLMNTQRRLPRHNLSGSPEQGSLWANTVTLSFFQMLPRLKIKTKFKCNY